jgi:hypothetical protein
MKDSGRTYHIEKSRLNKGRIISYGGIIHKVISISSNPFIYQKIIRRNPDRKYVLKFGRKHYGAKFSSFSRYWIMAKY